MLVTSTSFFKNGVVMMKNEKMSKAEKLFKALSRGDKLSEKQIMHRFAIANPRAHISYLRSKGFTIERVTSRDVNKPSKYYLAR